MASWEAILKTDGEWEVRGPVGDTLILNLECDDTIPEHDWTQWDFDGVVSGIGTFGVHADLGTTSTVLAKAMVLTETEPMVVGNEYAFAIRGQAEVGSIVVQQTWWHGVVIPLDNPLEA